ncbi:hypothetical protein G6F46_014511 [Rhizopus delemar]|nr:hypothetical protein G6F46_014511 [Rhizopus delemar]
MDATALRPVHHHRAGHQRRRRRCRQLGQPGGCEQQPQQRPDPAGGQRAPLIIGTDRPDQLSQAALLACIGHPPSPCLSWLGWSSPVCRKFVPMKLPIRYASRTTTS